jgi:hypothetical protein
VVDPPEVSLGWMRHSTAYVLSKRGMPICGSAFATEE